MNSRKCAHDHLSKVLNIHVGFTDQQYKLPFQMNYNNFKRNMSNQDEVIDRCIKSNLSFQMKNYRCQRKNCPSKTLFGGTNFSGIYCLAGHIFLEKFVHLLYQ